MPGVTTRSVRPAAVAGPAGPSRAQIDAAYAECRRVVSGHYENFPVASWLLPRHMRPHVAAVYAFARHADDFADEGELTDDERHRRLDRWQAWLHACGTATTTADPATPATFVALAHTMASRDVPVALLDDLLSAFRQDITTHRYASWADLLDYCRRSANPVGRIVLRIAGHRDPELDRASDCFCTALQLTNFWQDLEHDWGKGRLYVPDELRRRAGARESDLDARRWTPQWQHALEDAGARTRALFDDARPICRAVGGRLGLELRVTWLGGTTILDRLQASGYDVFARRPTLGALDALSLVGRAALWR